MTLLPYTNRLKRLEKALRHYLNPRERWWEVSTCTFAEWHGMWTVARTSGVLVDQGWLAIEPGGLVDTMVGHAHDAWFAAAETSYNEAKQRNTSFFVRVGRRAYVSSNGVKVITTTDIQPALVTAYRVKIKSCSFLTDPQLADRLILRREADKEQQHIRSASPTNLRAAVRRSLRYASLVQPLFAEDKEEG